MGRKYTRKCSICRMPGHDKRRCLFGGIEKHQERKIVPKPSAVFVRVEPKKISSPHVVNLKSTDKDVWKDVSVYEEKHTPKKRVTVDLASLIREANLRERIKHVASSKKKAQEKIKEKKPIFAESQVHTPEQKNMLRSSRDPKAGKRASIKIPNFSFRDIFDSIGARWNMKKFAYVTFIFLFVASIPFPAVAYYHRLRTDGDRVIEESTNAFLSLQSSTVAVFHSNIDQASYDLNSALESFQAATSIVEQEHKALVYVASVLPIIGKQVSGRQYLLRAGHHLALGNTYLVKGVSQIEAAGGIPVTDRLKIFRNHLRSAIPQYSQALEDLSHIDISIVPAEYQQSFEEFKLLFTALIDDMDNLVELIDMMETLFGADDFKRYLVIFQNNHELRPTGGFMGSFAVIDVQKGKILNIDVPGGGTYDLKGQLNEYVEPPLPMQLMNGRWEFQDANWFPDFPASARKAEWFYEHSRGATVDGVIAINATVFERLLGILGPMQNEEFDILLEAETALDELQYEVEVDYDKEENKPKAVLGSVLKQVLENLNSLKQMQIVSLFGELNDALGQKEIQVFANDTTIQERLEEYGWAGQIVSTKVGQDYLYSVFTNLQGQKSDARISQEIEHEARVQEDGTVVNTVVIRRTHNGMPGEQFYGGENIGYLRLYVPEGAVLLEAGGFAYPPEEAFKVPEDWYTLDSDLDRLEVEVGIHAKTGTRVSREFGKTAFGNWVVTTPGETSEIYFTYKLPFRVFDPDRVETPDDRWRSIFVNEPKETSRYSLFVQKQSGTESAFVSHIIYPKDWEPSWKTGDKVSFGINGAIIETVLETDNIFGFVMKKEE